MWSRCLLVGLSLLLVSLLLEACGGVGCECEGWNDVEVSWWDPTTCQSNLWAGNCGDSLSLTVYQEDDICINSSINCIGSDEQSYSWVVTGPQSYEQDGNDLPFCFEPPQDGNYLLELNGFCDGVVCPPCALNMTVNRSLPQCESEELKVCDCDSFNATKPDTPMNAPSDALLNWIAAHYYYSGTKACDEDVIDRYWAHTFTDLCKPCCHIVGASLEITIHHQDDTDGLAVGFISSPNDSWEVGGQLEWTDWPSDWPGGGIPLGEEGTITLDLSNVYLGNNTTTNLLSTIETNCFLDVAVQDDSTVDCARLSITYIAVAPDNPIVNYQFPTPEIETVIIPTGEDEQFETFDRIQMAGLYNYGEPGEPVLPYKTARILIPQNHTLVSVEVTGEKIKLPGQYLIEPGQVQIPTSSDNSTYTPPNPDIYQSENPFPASPYQVIAVQDFRGYKILLVGLIPVEYIPVDRELSYFGSMNVSVETAPIEEPNPLYRGTVVDEERVRVMVDNPELLKTYLPIDWPTPLALDPGDYDMVIITDSTLTPTFQEYANWRTNNRGISTIVYDIDTILTNYSGDDAAEKMRNFIIDAYTTWGIEYVLLGGDVEIIPYRLLYSKYDNGQHIYIGNIPADIYYAGLGGTWDNDNDHIYGEMNSADGTDEADLLADVYVGRAPVNDVTEAQNFCYKIRSYEESNLGTYRCDWLFFATKLSDTVKGGDYKDNTEDQKLGSSHGFDITTVYQSQGGTGAEVIDALNDGQRIGNSAGHGNHISFGMIDCADVDALTNTEYCLIYAWNCLTNKFEENDAISEYFLYTAHGAFAYIGNSRYGWWAWVDLGTYGIYYGASHNFELEFYDALLVKEIPRVGPALQDSKEAWSAYPEPYRWSYYSLNLMGDPSTLLRIKNDLWIKTSDNDDGSTPAPWPQWTSPDIRVDAPPYGSGFPSVLENAEYGSVNRIYVRVRNLGCEDADDVTVKLYWADPAGGIPWPSDWHYIGSDVISSIPTGCEEILYINWAPTGTAIGHRCLLATVETTGDPISIHNHKWDNNVAQRNVFIAELKSSYETEFVLNPPTLQGQRDLKITLLHAPEGATATLQIPDTVQIGEVEGASSISEPLSRWTMSCLPPPEGHVISVSGGANATAVVSDFVCDKKEVVNLGIKVPWDADTEDEFTVRITEELDGEIIGGVDYIARY